MSPGSKLNIGDGPETVFSFGKGDAIDPVFQWDKDLISAVAGKTIMTFPGRHKIVYKPDETVKNIRIVVAPSLLI